jgi:hypothetical protein
MMGKELKILKIPGRGNIDDADGQVPNSHAC